MCDLPRFIVAGPEQKFAQGSSEADMCLWDGGPPLPPWILQELQPVAPAPIAVGLAFGEFSQAGEPQRQRERRLGRLLAEKALSRAGYSGFRPLHNPPQQPFGWVGCRVDRSPAWPLGFVGSISHSRQWVWVAIAKRQDVLAVGIDTEGIVAPSTLEELRSAIGGKSEWDLLRNAALPARVAFTLLFSAKESFYKCCYPLVEQFWSFEDLELTEVRVLRNREVSSAESFQAAGTLTIAWSPTENSWGEKLHKTIKVSELQVHWWLTEGAVFTSCWIPASPTSLLPPSDKTAVVHEELKQRGKQVNPRRIEQ